MSKISDRNKKLILVFGATSEIGNEIIKKLSLMGYELVILGRNKSRKDKNYHYFISDIRNKIKLKELFKEIYLKFGFISGVVNCVGINNRKDIFHITYDEWFDEIETNLSGAFYIIKEIVSYLSNGASIVNIGSIMSHYPTKSPAYAASKAGLEGLTISLSKQLSNKNIRVNLVSPGPIKTKMISHLSKKRIMELQKKISLRRLGNSKEVANLVCFLISDESSYINGQIIRVDGGFF